MSRHIYSSRMAVIAAALAVTAPAFAEQPEDAWLTTKAKTELLTDDLVDGLAIHVDTFDAHVTLYGKVHTSAEKAEAERLVRAIEGVADVRNLLVVVPKGATKAVAIADAVIQQRVVDSLKGDAGLAGSSIRVKSVDKGVVILSGDAKTLTAHRRAIARTRRVEGVRRVASEIKSPSEFADSEIWHEGKVAGTGSSEFSDAWITTKAKLSLMTATGISPMAVNVDTEDGVVTLFGTVNTTADKASAGSQVGKLDGVKHVANELQVVPDVAAAGVAETDDRVTAAVRKRLAERASLADSKVTVATENGVVRLTGTVASQRDRLTALTVARSTRGVKSIIDDLSLKRAGM